jgi:hypothetical protein
MHRLLVFNSTSGIVIEEHISLPLTNAGNFFIPKITSPRDHIIQDLVLDFIFRIKE